MKRLLFVVLLTVLSAGVLSAREVSVKALSAESPGTISAEVPVTTPAEVPACRCSVLPPGAYRNLGLSMQTISFVGNDVLPFSIRSKGFAFTSGRSFFVYGKPVARLLYFSLDATWFDAEYGKWKGKVDGKNRWMYKVDVGAGIGIGAHVMPVDRLAVHTYFRYNPTYSGLVHNFAGDDNTRLEIDGGYASYFSTGLAVSWNVLSVGTEFRFGRGTYRVIRAPYVYITEDDIQVDVEDVLDKQKHKMRGWRFYVSLRF